jgi:hypothetical protein
MHPWGEPGSHPAALPSRLNAALRSELHTSTMLHVPRADSTQGITRRAALETAQALGAGTCVPSVCGAVDEASACESARAAAACVLAASAHVRAAHNTLPPPHASCAAHHARRHPTACLHRFPGLASPAAQPCQAAHWGNVEGPAPLPHLSRPLRACREYHTRHTRHSCGTPLTPAQLRPQLPRPAPHRHLCTRLAPSQLPARPTSHHGVHTQAVHCQPSRCRSPGHRPPRAGVQGHKVRR